MNSTFRNAVEILNKNYFISFSFFPSQSELLRVKIQMNISYQNIYSNRNVSDFQMLASRVETER